MKVTHAHDERLMGQGDWDHHFHLALLLYVAVGGQVDLVNHDYYYGVPLHLGRRQHALSPQYHEDEQGKMDFLLDLASNQMDLSSVEANRDTVFYSNDTFDDTGRDAEVLTVTCKNEAGRECVCSVLPNSVAELNQHLPRLSVAEDRCIAIARQVWQHAKSRADTTWTDRVLEIQVPETNTKVKVLAGYAPRPELVDLVEPEHPKGWREL